MNPKVSVVMPTYNREGYFLQEAIYSLLKQTFLDFELIVIDDGSTDNTEKQVFSFKDKRIYYYKTASNHGEYWATNYGANLARGKYLTWLHTDDLLPKNSLKYRVEMLDANQHLDFVHGDIAKIDEKGNLLEKIEAVNWSKDKIISQYLTSFEKRKKKYLVHHTTVAMKWNFFYKAGPFDASLPFAGDIDWLIRAIRAGNFAVIHKILYFYRSHPQTRRVLDIKKGVDKAKINKMIMRRYAQP